MAEEVKAAVAESEGKNFIDAFIEEDIAEGGRFQGQQVHTRFPPEPNGYLHIGHCKALCIDFGTAEKFGGLCNLRMDDTNPAKEDTEFVDAIQEDIRWLGFDWGDRFFYGSDYFEKTYALALGLIKKGLAYVCELTPDEFSAYRGDTTHPAVSPFRDRPVEESLDLFARMRAGEFPEGKYTLRAKIDPDSDNPYLRDPVIFRIRHIHHHRQGDKFCIYPMYDFAHPLQDALEGITHSLCSSEFRNHRPLYDWVIENCGPFSPCPKQREFGRMNVTYTVMSKRFLRFLVEHGVVDGWDDPRMPTLCALRRRGYTPHAIFDFVERAGVAKADATVDAELLDHCQREELNDTAPRRVCVTEPLKVVITNYPADKTETFSLPNHPAKPELGTRQLPFGREIYIERSDFAEVPPPKFFRMRPGAEVRLMGAYIVRCDEVIKNEAGEVTELHCTAGLESGCGNPTDGRKIKGTIHWISAASCVDLTLAMYDRLFTIPDVASYTTSEHKVEEILEFVNPDSARMLPHAKAEPSVLDTKPGEAMQFVRMGYFTKDSKHEGTFNRILTLKDSYKIN